MARRLTETDIRRTQRVRAAYLVRGISGRELSRQMGKVETWAEKIGKGRQRIDFDEAKQLASILGCSVDWIWEGCETDRPSWVPAGPPPAPRRGRGKKSSSNGSTTSQDIASEHLTAPIPGQGSGGGTVDPPGTEDPVTEAERSIARMADRIAAGDTSPQTMLQFLMASTAMRDIREAREARTRELRERNLSQLMSLPHDDGRQEVGGSG